MAARNFWKRGDSSHPALWYMKMEKTIVLSCSNRQHLGVLT
jgi:hypothetical protein